MTPDPIAIVGRACILPESRTPDALWNNLIEGRDLISNAPDQRWRIDMARAIHKSGIDTVWTDRGGYVTDDIRFEAPAFEGLDPLFHWTATCAKEAMEDANWSTPERTQLILANLSYPTEAFSKYGESIWFEKLGVKTDGGDPRNQKMSGLPAHLTASELGLGEAFALDAACASALYAIKLAAIRLQLGLADGVLVGAVNRADPLFIHQGFCALQALSKLGKSRPFHPEADGLIPAEGCAFLALKRLQDVSDGEHVYGVIHNVGLSNDGRARGFLAPSANGQTQAMRSAYEGLELDPKDVGFIECHATGTQLGDQTELSSIAEVFGDAVKVGSHKSNFGHAITVAGMVGVLKCLGVLEHGLIPATLHLSNPTSSFHIPTKPTPFDGDVVAVNAFGFGGNNAHLILTGAGSVTPQAARPPITPKKIYLCRGIEKLETDGFKTIDVTLKGLRFPPKDLEHTIPQQLAVLSTVRELLDGIEHTLDSDRTGFVVGMSCDLAVTRYGARWRWEGDPSLRDRIVPELSSAGVIGVMPNIVANRLNAQFDIRGPSFTVSSESLGELDAVGVARDLMSAGILDHVVVASFDADGQGCRASLLSVEDLDALAKVEIAETTSGSDRSLASSAQPKLFESPQTISRSESGQTRAISVAPLDTFVPIDTLPNVVVIRGESREQIESHLADGTPPSETSGPAALAFTDRASKSDLLTFIRSGRAEDRARSFYFRDAPIQGSMAFVFTGSGAAYPEMLDGYQHIPALASPFPRDHILRHFAWIDQGKPPTSVSDLWTTSFMSLFHATVTKNVLPRPTAAIGCSLGEANALLAFGAWTDKEAMSVELSNSPLFAELLAHDFAAARAALSATGDIEAATREGQVWSNWNVTGPVDWIVDLVAEMPNVHVSAVVTPNQCVVSGERDACDEAVVQILNNPKCFANENPAAIVSMHVPEVSHAESAFRQLHTRDVADVPDVAFYTNATNHTYELSREACAEMLYRQAITTIDFRRTIQNAYDDGVRVFVEHGPRALCSGWIGECLDGKDHIAVSMDRVGRTPAEAWFDVAAQLLVAGIDVDLDALRSFFLQDEKPEPVEQPTIQINTWPDVTPFEPIITPIAVSWPTVPDVPSPPEWSAVEQRPASWRTPLTQTERRPLQKPAARQFSVGDTHAQFVAEQAEVYQTFLRHYVENQQRFLGIEPPDLSDSVTPGPIASGPQTKTQTQTQTEPGKNPTSLTREQLEFLSRGNISEVWGEAFQPLDNYDVLVRMPEPPLLLADRVIEIDAEPASMKPGRIVTETDVTEDAWYLNHRRMPAGIMIESGQADLLLVSYLGVDLLNKGERAYRLLGCKLTYHDELPEVGETLRYDISIDGFAKHGDVRLFFFHYDCHSDDGRRGAGPNDGRRGEGPKNIRGRLSVRDGQAGFFTEEELEASGGVLWEEAEAGFDPALPFDLSPQRTHKQTFTVQDVQAFAAGRPRACFGESHAYTDTHTRSPSIWGGDKLFFERVTDLNFDGGPIGRGYFRAEAKNHPDKWFFDGHFHNDPCMPGTLMFEGCLQTMAFYMAAAGQTMDKDGWRFEPVPEMEFHMRCRGQCTPESQDLVYELFVEGLGETVEGYPVLYADLLVTVDGLKAFHCRRMALRLVPDWIAPRVIEPQSPGTIVHGNYPSLLATANGRPSDAFGEMYRVFDSPKKAPRLPGQPYHFMSRVVDASDGDDGYAVVEYDVPADEWYFEHTGEMPFAVLLETGLQPCGWLASYVGCAAETEVEVFFRNLDGTGTLHDVVRPTDHVVRTETKLTKRVRSGDVTLVSFDVVMTVDGRPLYTLETMFGFFPAKALAEQRGLEGPELPMVVAPTPTTRALESDMLRMVDAIEIDGDHIVGTKTFDPSNWFFKAHFFQDPVQPGSLGLEALLQCVRAYALRHGVTGTPRVTLERPHRWSYRGQVRPHNREGTFDVTMKSVTDKTFVADGWLFVDGLRIYEFEDLAITFE